jgi:hypothetical protein
MEALKELKDLVDILWLDADAQGAVGVEGEAGEHIGKRALQGETNHRGEHDAVPPGGELGRAGELTNSLEGREESFLYGILRVMLVAEQTPGDGEQTTSALPYELLKRFILSTAQPYEELRVVSMLICWG